MSSSNSFNESIGDRVPLPESLVQWITTNNVKVTHPFYLRDTNQQQQQQQSSFSDHQSNYTPSHDQYSNTYNYYQDQQQQYYNNQQQQQQQQLYENYDDYDYYQQEEEEEQQQQYYYNNDEDYYYYNQEDEEYYYEDEYYDEEEEEEEEEQPTYVLSDELIAMFAKTELKRRAKQKQEEAEYLADSNLIKEAVSNGDADIIRTLVTQTYPSKLSTTHAYHWAVLYNKYHVLALLKQLDVPFALNPLSTHYPGYDFVDACTGYLGDSRYFRWALEHQPQLVQDNLQYIPPTQFYLMGDVELINRYVLNPYTHCMPPHLASSGTDQDFIGGLDFGANHSGDLSLATLQSDVFNQVLSQRGDPIKRIDLVQTIIERTEPEWLKRHYNNSFAMFLEEQQQEFDVFLPAIDIGVNQVDDEKHMNAITHAMELIKANRIILKTLEFEKVTENIKSLNTRFYWLVLETFMIEMKYLKYYTGIKTFIEKHHKYSNWKSKFYEICFQFLINQNVSWNIILDIFGDTLFDIPNNDIYTNIELVIRKQTQPLIPIDDLNSIDFLLKLLKFKKNQIDSNNNNSSTQLLSSSSSSSKIEQFKIYNYNRQTNESPSLTTESIWEELLQDHNEIHSVIIDCHVVFPTSLVPLVPLHLLDRVYSRAIIKQDDALLEQVKLVYNKSNMNLYGSFLNANHIPLKSRPKYLLDNFGKGLVTNYLCCKYVGRKGSIELFDLFNQYKAYGSKERCLGFALGYARHELVQHILLNMFSNSDAKVPWSTVSPFINYSNLTIPL
ncbi:hypothetical protein DFA_09307 [Cavenderia fasciculata]|uniref:Uncharacterized protein n=1 Tax=Cavenderia fasciculata TaxID=261658 RepID=F4Q795_CACFS|nr:uncharacterized protein DFA_09307 [Cavenderia fasciculata]EGG16277.1 hypothetical protein DFA_09307 [Cavenderia fasciculata]|eukprot:XP_004354661.1 hypothetical protein DFA_09307 [Cavenderia fasciculata]